MPKPRNALISLDTMPYYHCSSRCVRRAYLCGIDPITGTDYEHRRQWIENRLLELATIFSIDVAAYAVLNNHYHVVLHVDRDQAKSWSPLEVVHRWHRLFKGNRLSQRYSSGEALDTAEWLVMDEIISTWRNRLMNISWYMRIINEGIARTSNREENCTGRFWEGRFSCQALLDEKALATCAVYVDLNPIRAKLADTPETSDHTSIQRRIKQALKTTHPNDLQQQDKQLMVFAGNPKLGMPEGLPFQLTDYMELVEWTGRILRNDKRGAIHANIPPMLARLNIDQKQWLNITANFEERFKTLVGDQQHIKVACEQLGQRWSHSLKACRESFPG